MLCGPATGMLGQKNVEIAVPMRNQVMAVRTSRGPCRPAKLLNWNEKKSEDV